MERKGAEYRHTIGVPLRVEQGTDFHPFRDTFPPLIFDFGNYGDLLLSRDFNFEGVWGSLHLVNAYGSKLFVDTPLGPVENTQVLHGESMVVTKAPVTLAFSFYVKTQAEYDKLDKNKAVVTINDRKYALDLTENLKPGVAKIGFGRYQEVSVTTFYNENGDRRTVLLPYGTTVLSKLKININTDNNKLQLLPAPRNLSPEFKQKRPLVIPLRRNSPEVS